MSGLVYDLVTDRELLTVTRLTESRAYVYTSAGDCRQRKWATVVSSRQL